MNGSLFQLRLIKYFIKVISNNKLVFRRYYLTDLTFGNNIPKMNERLKIAVYLIIKSLVGLLFRNGIAFGEFSRLAKLAYIEVTEKELIASGQKSTTSMISISTGLTRKEVSFLRKDLSPNHSHSTQQKNRAIRVISAWISDLQFCDEYGNARVLDIQGDKGSFEQLVHQHSGDMPYRAMLNELLRTEAVDVGDDQKVTLLRAVYIPSGDEDGKYDLLGEDVSLLISTIQHNIVSKDEEPLFQRKVSYNNIPEESLKEFKQLANTENQLLLVKLNTWLSEHDMDKDTTISSQNPVKVGVGIYYFDDKKSPKVTNDEN